MVEGPTVSLKTPSSWVLQHCSSLVGILLPLPLTPHHLPPPPSVLGLWSKLAFLPRLPIRGAPHPHLQQHGLLGVLLSWTHMDVNTQGQTQELTHKWPPHPQPHHLHHHKLPGAVIETGCFFFPHPCMWINWRINKRATRLHMCFFYMRECVCVCRYDRDRGCHPECTPCFDWANTLCAGSYVFHLQTDSRTNKHHSLPTHVSLDFVPPVSFYLKACLVTSSSLLDLKTSLSVRVSSIMGARNTLVSLPEALRTIQCLF